MPPLSQHASALVNKAQTGQPSIFRCLWFERLFAGLPIDGGQWKKRVMSQQQDNEQFRMVYTLNVTVNSTPPECTCDARPDSQTYCNRPSHLHYLLCRKAVLPRRPRQQETSLPERLCKPMPPLQRRCGWLTSPLLCRESRKLSLLPLTSEGL